MGIDTEEKQEGKAADKQKDALKKAGDIEEEDRKLKAEAMDNKSKLAAESRAENIALRQVAQSKEAAADLARTLSKQEAKLQHKRGKTKVKLVAAKAEEVKAAQAVSEWKAKVESIKQRTAEY